MWIKILLEGTRIDLNSFGASLKDVINLVFPSFCVSCGKKIPFQRHLCESCEYEIKRKVPQVERHRGYDLFFHSFYEGPLRDAIISYKSGRWRLKDFLSSLIIDVMEFFKVDFDSIVPIPPTLSSLEERGFDHMWSIAKILSRRTGKRVVRALVQIGEERQFGKGARERRKVLDRFEMVSHPGKRIALIDDVYTTGSTVRGCISTLKKGGVEKVYVFVLARTRRG